jgi:hypothetical protein
LQSGFKPGAPMKNLLCLGILCVLNGCSGSKDTKNEVENYPNYDTSQKVEQLNDNTKDTAQPGGDDMRTHSDH